MTDANTKVTFINKNKRSPREISYNNNKSSMLRLNMQQWSNVDQIIEKKKTSGDLLLKCRYVQ